MNSSPALIGVDWGTSSFRAYLLSRKGKVLDRIDASSGILAIADSDFMNVLVGHCRLWRVETPGLPIVMCGMIGSQQGWVETEYVSGKSGIAELSAAVTKVGRDDIEIYLIPGVQGGDFDAMPDVMRGEETILAGAIAGGSVHDGLVCLPGTHSKWVSLESGRIGAFATFMSGELFALLSRNSILSAQIVATEGLSPEIQERSFNRGLELAASASDLLHQLFMIRAQLLVGSSEPLHAGEMLSGLLIGTELASIARSSSRAPKSVLLAATGELGTRYEKALLAMGWSVECVDSELACSTGLHAVAEAAGILSRQTGNAQVANEGSQK